jgi:hypothetical protein
MKMNINREFMKVGCGANYEALASLAYGGAT